MKKIVINQLTLPAGTPESELTVIASNKYKTTLHFDRILRKSVDARDRGRVIISYRIVFKVADGDLERVLRFGAEAWEDPAAPVLERCSKPPKVVIIGSGPAGLFAALRLLARGIPSVILERGKPVEQRNFDIEQLRQQGILDPESNVVFGEGGAGTWSDGKLTTRINKDGIDWIFDKLVEHGAPKNILWDSKPHIGTDILAPVVARIRATLEKGGCEFHFGEKVTGLIIKDGTITGVACASGTHYSAWHVIAATGHSARDFYEMLSSSGISLEAKGFAVGMRIEHPVDFINRNQYGEFAGKLGAADYRLVFNNPVSGRGIYSFCMCPGGEVVNSSSEPGKLCVNGMSWSKRDLATSNSAIVVNVRPEDMAAGALAGIEFQRGIEQAAFLAGGGGFASPAMQVRDYVHSVQASHLQAKVTASYLPGVKAADLAALYPDFINQEIRAGLLDFDRKIPGFIDQGVLIGVETRTSSPVRISRGADYQSISLRRFYPAGEGGGYSGGIVSSAVDGLRIADYIATEHIG